MTGARHVQDCRAFDWLSAGACEITTSYKDLQSVTKQSGIIPSRPEAKVVLPSFDGGDDVFEVIVAEHASEIADLPIMISDKYAAT